MDTSNYIYLNSIPYLILFLKLEDEKECESISVSMPDSSHMRPDMHGGDLGE